MGQKQGRTHLTGDAAQVGIGPRRMDITVEAWLGAMVVPCHTEPIRIDRRFALLRLAGLLD